MEKILIFYLNETKSSLMLFFKLCMKGNLYGNAVLLIKRTHHGPIIVYLKNINSQMYTVNLTVILNIA